MEKDGAGAAAWHRRDFLGGAVLFAMVVGVPAAVVMNSNLGEDDRLTDRQSHLIADISQLVIPRTMTAGAGEAGVGDFVILALTHGLEGTRAPMDSAATPSIAQHLRQDGSLRHLDWLEQDLDHRAGGDFPRHTLARRSALLTALDKEAFAEGVQSHPWRTIKSLILTGFYTSEVGGSKELRYELVPGRWDPDVPLKPGDRAFSSDWTAVDFG